MKPKTLSIVELSAIAFLIALFMWWAYPKPPTGTNISTTATSTIQAPAFPIVNIEAKAAYIYDSKNKKVLYAKKPDEQLPLASLTKLMSALVASTVIPDYMLVRITPSDIRVEGDSGLFPDEEWSIGKLIDYSLVVSSNDGIRAVAELGGAEIASTTSATASSTQPLGTPEALFIARMNSMAKEIGLGTMFFMNESGLDLSQNVSGGYGSARDVALLVDYILKKDSHLLEATALAQTNISSENELHVAKNTNTSMPVIPNILASKTGYTDLSGGNVVVAWNAGLDHPIIISVLGSSYDGRFSDLDILVQATLEYISLTDTPR